MLNPGACSRVNAATLKARDARALEAANVRYLVVGGVAVYAWGYERFTKDLDLVVQVVPETVEKIFAALAAAGYRPAVPLLQPADLSDPHIRGRLVQERNLTAVQFISEEDPESSVDLLINEPFDFQEQYAQAFVSELPGGAEVRILGIDALLQMKAQAGREQDLADIAILNKVHGRAAGQDGKD